MTVLFATPGLRGCGDSRIAGGIYAETSHGPGGLPIEAFLMDPPIIPREGMEIAQRGVNLLRQDVADGKGGTRVVWHLMDWVGEQHYPNVADFVEEVRRLGLSRRIQSTFAFDLLSPESRILLIHPRAFVANWKAYWDVYAPSRQGWKCPKCLATHVQGEVGPCACIWWRDVEGGVQSAMQPTEVVRSIPSGQYIAWPAPEGVEGEYVPAFFLSLPIGRIAVVKAPDGSHTQALDKAKGARIRVDEVEE